MLDSYKVMKRPSTTDGRQGLLVRVYDDCISFKRREFVYDRQLGDDWVMPLPSVEPKPFTFAGRAAAEKDPEFCAGAALSIGKTRAKTRGGTTKKGKEVQKIASAEKDAITLSFPPATAVRSVRPIEYELKFTPDSGETVVRHVLANGFNQSVEDSRTNERQVCTIALDQLPTVPFKIEVRALSSLGRKSAPLCGEFKS